MKWQEVMTFLSGLGMGAMLVQKNGIIAAINEVGKSFLAMSEGVGTPVPDNARPLLLPLKDKQIAHIAFEKWVRRVKCPLVQGIPEGMELIVFRDAACDVYREMFQKRPEPDQRVRHFMRRKRTNPLFERCCRSHG